MKTIRYTTAIIMMCLGVTGLQAQDVDAKFSEAESAYASRNLDNTRFALQGALGEINKAIGMQILDLLPKKIKDISYNEKEDNVSGAAGFAGLFVNRSYGTEPNNGSIEIMSDSPLLTALNAMLSMPAMLGTGDPNQKRIKVGGYKSVLQKETGQEGIVSYTLQIPVNQTLVMLKTKGIPNENDVINIGNALPLDQIAKLAN